MFKTISVLVALSALVLIVSAQNLLLRGAPPGNDADKLLQGEYRQQFIESATKANMTQELIDYGLNFKRDDGEKIWVELEQVYKEIDWTGFSAAISKAISDLSSQFMEKSKDKKLMFELASLIAKFGVVKH